MPDVTRALEQIAEIHAQLGRTRLYRGWRSLPVAASGLVGLGAAAWQQTWPRPLDPMRFAGYWLTVGACAAVVASMQIAWQYLTIGDERDRAHTRQVVGQFLPSLVAGALASAALDRLGAPFVPLLPGLWAVFFGVGVFSIRPHAPRAAGWVALYYWLMGVVLLWTADGADALSPWSVGGTFGVGQLLGAGVLYVNLERAAPDPPPSFMDDSDDSKA